MTEPHDPGGELDDGLDLEADDEPGGGAIRFLIVLVVVVGLLLLLAAAAHPSGVEGCGGA